MTEAKLYGQNKGGISINGIIKDYYAYAGENISAGDLVEFINGVSKTENYGTSEYTTLSELSSSYFHKAVQLTDDTVFVAHLGYISKNYYCHGTVIKINKNVISEIGSYYKLISNYGVTGMRVLDVVALSENSVLVAFRQTNSGYNVIGVVCTISGTTITVGTQTTMCDSTSGNIQTNLELVEPNKVVVFTGYNTNGYLYGTVSTISGTTITKGSLYSINTSKYAGIFQDSTILSDGRIAIVHSYSGSYHLACSIVSITDKVITVGFSVTIEATSNNGQNIAVSSLPGGDNRILVTYNNASNIVCAKICKVNASNITLGTAVSIGSVSNTSDYQFYPSIPLANGSAMVFYTSTTSFQLYSAYCSISSMTITLGKNQLLNENAYTGLCVRPLMLANGSILLSHRNASSYLSGRLYCFDTTEQFLVTTISIPAYETQVRKVTTPKFDGVAKTKGIGGDNTEHNDLVSIWTLE